MSKKATFALIRREARDVEFQHVNANGIRNGYICNRSRAVLFLTLESEVNSFGEIKVLIVTIMMFTSTIEAVSGSLNTVIVSGSLLL